MKNWEKEFEEKFGEKFIIRVEPEYIERPGNYGGGVSVWTFYCDNGDIVRIQSSTEHSDIYSSIKFLDEYGYEELKDDYDYDGD